MQLKDIFPINQNSNGYGGFNLKIQRYNVDITTYRKEKKYEGSFNIGPDKKDCLCTKDIVEKFSNQ